MPQAAPFSTPFDSTAVNSLKRVKFPAHKIASFGNADTPIFRRITSRVKLIGISAVTFSASRKGSESEVL
ncbi:MAG: N-acetylneuraminate synthase family protein [Deltaproteobacteria bacterium]|nr:MAG: N-acetylneuraminate synthase family protein [Deltaproteobacteria bacterium]